MNKLFKKLLLSILTGVILIFSLVPSVLAQGTPQQGTNTNGQQASTTQATPGPWYNQNYEQWSQKVFDTSNPNEIFGERYTYAQINWIINSLTAVIIGSNISSCIASTSAAQLQSCMQSLTVDASKACPTCTSQLNGAIPVLANLSNSLLNTRPASGIDYVKNNLARLHVISPAYAQSTNGAGFNTLQPIQNLWGALRDISYVLLIFVIIIMAFMIMFRVKMSPQAVVTVQSALPKIAIALILITFSYAIAGFLVDLSYVVIGIFAVAVQALGHNIVTGNSPIALFNQLNSGNGLASIIIGLIIFASLMLTAGVAILPELGITSIATGIGAVAGVAFIVSGVLLLILVIIILFVILRLLWLLIRTACITVLLIVVGPLMILFGTVSNQMGFGRWFRQLAANLSVYPTVSIMIFLSHYFFWGWFLGSANPNGVFLAGCGSTITPSFNTYCINSATAAVPGSSGIVGLPGASVGVGFLGLVMSFVILFLIPHAAKIIESMIEGKHFDFGAAARSAFTGGLVGTVVGLGTGTINKAITDVGVTIVKNRVGVGLSPKQQETGEDVLTKNKIRGS